MEKDKEIVKIVLDELENRGIIKKNLNSFDNTVQLLYQYPKLKDSIKDRKEQIKDLKSYGLQEKSKSITAISMNNAKKDDDDELIQSNISSLKQHIHRTEVILKYIDSIIDKFKRDKYYEVIRLYYFEHKTHDQIAEYLDSKKNKDSNTSPETIRQNKNRLIREMKTYFFPNDVITEILGY